MNCCHGCGAALEGLYSCQYCGRPSEATSGPRFRAAVKEFTVTVDGLTVVMRESWELGLAPSIVKGPGLTHCQSFKLGVLCRIRAVELGEIAPKPGQTKAQTAAMLRKQISEVA